MESSLDLALFHTPIPLLVLFLLPRMPALTFPTKTKHTQFSSQFKPSYSSSTRELSSTFTTITSSKAMDDCSLTTIRCTFERQALFPLIAIIPGTSTSCLAHSRPSTKTCCRKRRRKGQKKCICRPLGTYFRNQQMTVVLVEASLPSLGPFFPGSPSRNKIKDQSW